MSREYALGVVISAQPSRERGPAGLPLRERKNTRRLKAEEDSRDETREKCSETDGDERGTRTRRIAVDARRREGGPSVSASLQLYCRTTH